MSATFDLNIFPIVRVRGQDQTVFPGLYAATPPPRPARGREDNNLVLYLSLEGLAWLPPEHQTQWLTRLAQQFYKTPGAVTSVMRKMVEMLNHSLLEWNINHPASQVIAYLTQMVIRHDQIYLAHSGPGHAYVMSPASVQDYSDLEESGPGLGLSRSVLLRYFQFSLQGGEFILLTCQPGDIWQVEDLQIAPNQGMESMRRKLLVGRTDADLNAVLIQALPGSGKLRFLRLKTSYPDMARPQTSQPRQAALAAAPGVPMSLDHAEAAVTMPEPGRVSKPEGAFLESSLPPVRAETSAGSPAESAGAPPTGKRSLSPQAAQQPASRAAAGRSPAGKATSTKKGSLESGSRKLVRRFLLPMLSVASAFGTALMNAFRQIGGFFLTWLKRVLPDESLLNLSPKTLLFIAIAAPLVVSVIGGMVYIERGQAAQYQRFYNQALDQAAQATAKSDPLEQRLAWQTVLNLLDQAEFYRVTPESQTLRNQARQALDLLDGIERLEYQPALLSNLEKTVRITRIAAQGGDLYLLNGAQGNVIRAVLTGGGYQIDAQFSCGPVSGGAAAVGPLIDIVPLPRGEESKATLLGVDASGTLILCIPGEQPLIQSVNPPAINFGEIRAFDLNAGDLYYLDPPQNAVWIYRGRATANPPRLFFGEEIPHMRNVVDLMVNGEDLYMLHADGHQTLCTYQMDSATRCEDPVEYVDMRPGRHNGPVIPDALFTQIQFAPPPDPSLYLLEPKSQAIYHFSLRLVLQRQYQPLQALSDEPATAFAISPSRMVFLAIGNQVYYAALP